MDILNFIFQDFWHWMGTLILLIAICPWNKVRIGNPNSVLENGYQPNDAEETSEPPSQGSSVQSPKKG